jgi:hypothetical protein
MDGDLSGGRCRKTHGRACQMAEVAEHTVVDVHLHNWRTDVVRDRQPDHQIYSAATISAVAITIDFR